MTETTVGNEVKCECGKILAQPSDTPAGFLIRNSLHKQRILLAPGVISIRGHCPGCSKLHTLTYPVFSPGTPARQRRRVQIIGQLSLF